MSVPFTPGTSSRTVQEAVEIEIRRAILTGQLPSGAKLNQEHLARALGASRVPVRETLRKLEAEGLVTFTPHRGAVVAPILSEDIDQIFEVRIALEGLAARRGATRLSESDLDRLSTLIEEMQDAADSPDRWLQLNRQFHGTIYAASGNSRLVRIIDGLRAHVTAYQRLSIAVPGRMQASALEHRTILDACRAGDGAQAARATLDHLRRTASVLMESLAAHTA